MKTEAYEKARKNRDRIDGLRKMIEHIQKNPDKPGLFVFSDLEGSSSVVPDKDLTTRITTALDYAIWKLEEDFDKI